MKNFDNFFYPKSIAIVGASSKEGALSYELINNLIKFGFKGKIFPINPKADIILSLPVYKSLLDIAEEINLAVIMLPKQLVFESLEECGKKNIKSVILITAGFKETGTEGALLENELLNIIEKYDISLVGPNCMGILNTKADVSMNGTFILGEPYFGKIGFCSQSGALGAAVLKTVKQNDIGMGQFISIGNKADVTENDIIRYWKDCDDINVITLYLESFANPKEFVKITKEAVKKKPVLVLKAARTEAGMRAASSHTGALASGDAIANAIIEHSGATRVDTTGQLFDIAKIFDRGKAPKGNRIGILTNAGGPAIICVDECDHNGLEVPALSDESKKKIFQIALPEASLNNPVDLLPPATADMWSEAARIIIEDENIDCLIVIMGPPLMLDTVKIMYDVNEKIKHSEKTVLFVMMSQDEKIAELQRVCGDSLPPFFKFPESPARALGEMLKFENRKKKIPEDKIEFEVNKIAVEIIFSKIKTKGTFYLGYEDVYNILLAYGLPIIDSLIIENQKELLNRAEEIKFPVVLKVLGKELIHKTDVGGVKLDIKNKEELANAITEIEKTLRDNNLFEKLEGYLLQPFYKGGIETILGIIKDSSAGHLVMFGLGGIMVELLNDVKFRLLEHNETDVMEMIKALKGYKILKGIRGKKGADLNYIVECIMRLAKLVNDFPQFEEIDLNPLVFGDKENSFILDARMKVNIN
jgi:acetate---CoA ligase (ADP-forming)